MESNKSLMPEARLHFLDYWRVVKSRKAIVFVVFLIVVLVAATVTFFQPKIYASASRIKVEQERLTVEVFQQQGYAGYDPYFLQTQYEIIQSQKILYPVIERFDLRKRWAYGGDPLPLEMTFRMLRRAMSVQRFRDTSLIEIRVFDQNPQLAADLANSIADTFEKDRLEVRRQQTMKGIAKVQEELEKQEKKVREAQDKVERLRKELNVQVFGTVKLNDMTVQQLESQLTLARVEFVGRDTRLKELKKLTHEQLRNAIATVLGDPTLQQLSQQLSDSEVRLAVLKQDFGPDHPQVKGAVVQRDTLSQQVESRLDGIMRGYEVEFRMYQERVSELQKQLDELKKASVDMESEAFLPFRNAQREEESEMKLYEVLKQRLQQVSIELQVPRSPVEKIDSGEPSLAPVKPNWTLNLTLGGLVGLLLGIGLAFFIEFLDTSLKIMDDVERYLGLPVLGVIPQQAVLLSNANASQLHLEAYRMLRTNLDFSYPGTGTKSIAILSSAAGEGKSFTLANLAFVYAQQGLRVLVVDTDLRRPTAHKYYGIGRENGLSDYLAGSQTLDEVIHQSNQPNIWMIPAGEPQSAKAALPLLTSQRMNHLIHELAQRFDVVLYDTPPVLGISDAAVVAREVGNAILVVQHRRYPRAMSQRARKMIEHAGGKLLGVVANNVHVDTGDNYYYYHEHYEHYLREREKPSGGKQTKTDEMKLEGKY
ncbi:MAG: polysaccharide biosynthesis tyrosine autokinase [Verrucomicrobia bacterium]|nr:polysaccharide biosynthesis tyrosine autokinase [Verrucomicrobiota bacterium]